MTKEIVRVNLGEKKSYDIVIGNEILSDFSSHLNKTGSYSKVFVITDSNVAKFHLKAFSDNLNQSGISHKSIIIEAGEKSKDFANLQNLCGQILKEGIDRKALLIALGGGVIGDLCAFVASILLRGISFVQVPTTLLAAVDSSVGGKTAINSEFGKNLIGSFYQPKLVFCDLNFLNSLSEREFLSGYGEVVKYGLIKDHEFFSYLEQNWQKIKDRDVEALTKVVMTSCKIKAQIVSIDEKEGGVRALLNLGHSFGHVYETETNYSNELFHGEAVAIGMIMAAKMSAKIGIFDANEINKIEDHLQKVGLPTSSQDIRKEWNIENLVSHVYKDKKVEGGKLTFILLERIGCAIIKKDVDKALFIEVITS
ncbi:MAG: 3-dehydroquinate synthase [Proteobacteria bacterium]|nr:3-dehydroquinate synthase [Pseudomonadota bacterium]